MCDRAPREKSAEGERDQKDYDGHLWINSPQRNLPRLPPNGSRLSCGAEYERSQTEDYLRERGAVSFRRLLGGYARKSPQVLKTGGWPPFPSNRSWSISWRTVK